MRSLAPAVPLALLTSVAASARASSSQYFPRAEIVLDMAVLSDAVYHLRKKVGSCNTTLAHSLDYEMANGNEARFRRIRRVRREMLRAGGGDGETTEAQDVFNLLLPEGAECLHYSHDYSLGTQALVVRSNVHKYVAVAYAGTDDWKTALQDGDMLTGEFGPDPTDEISPLFEGVPEGAHVHRGFNSAVFDSDSFHTILDCVASARLGGSCDGNDGAGIDEDPSSSPYQLFTTGHSLGAADSVLLGATLHLTYPDEATRSINFGCPKVGNAKWSFWADSLQPDNGGQTPEGRTTSSTDGDGGNKGGGSSGGSFEIFRFVNKIDLIPRLPDLIVYTHAGHTMQMSVGGGIKAYYDHVGNDDLGYAGVPFGWEAAPFALLPFAVASHPSSHYVEYLDDYRPDRSDSNASNVGSYVDGFERAGDRGRELSYA